MPLRGSFSETAPEDVLQILSLGGKTGVLSVVDGDRRLELIFENGMIIDAFDGLGRGTEVVFSVLAAHAGSFTFTAQDVPSERTIDSDMPSLLLAGAYQMDHLTHARALMQQPLARPCLAPEHEPEPDALNDADRTVLQAIDGRCNLGELSVACPLGLKQFYVSVGRLIEEGIITLATAGQQTSPLLAPTADGAPLIAHPPEEAPFEERPPTTDEIAEVIAYLRYQGAR